MPPDVSRYDSTGDASETEYVDRNQTILANLPGIMDLDTLLRREEEGLATAYELLLGEVRVDTPLTSELIRHVHSRIFGEIYAWAGRWRRVWISKPGVTWPPPDHLDEAMRQFERAVLAKYPVANLASDDDFCNAAAHMQGEFLAIHPFREGNARTIKLVTDLLAAQTGRPILLYEPSDEGTRAYIQAAKAAMFQDFGPMTVIICQALNEARGAP